MKHIQKELSHLTSLLWIAMKQGKGDLSITPSSYASLSAHFDLSKPIEKPKKTLAIVSNPTPSIALKPLPQKEEKKQELKLEISSESIDPFVMEEVMDMTPNEQNKKQERLLPLSTPLPSTDLNGVHDCLSPSILSKECLYPPTQITIRWAILPYVSGNEPLLQVITSLTKSIQTKLCIQTSLFNQKEEKLALRLKAASLDYEVLLISGEPHNESQAEKSLIAIGATQDQTGHSYPLLRFLSRLNRMKIYYLSLPSTIHTDVQVKRKVWASLQELLHDHR